MSRSEKILIAVAAGLILFSLFSGMGSHDLRGEEPRRAVVSMEMVLSGRYVVPHVNGWPYYNKPPLFNWVVALMYNVFGSFDEWVSRLPSLVALFLTAMLNYFVAGKYLGKKTALLGSLFFITSADIFFYGSSNAGELDFFYALLVYVQVISIIHFYIRKKFGRLYLVSYGFMALGVLCKGLPSLAFQGLTLLGLFIYDKNPKTIFNRHHVAGILLFVAMTGIYLVLYSRHGPVTGLLARQFVESYDRSFVKMDLLHNILEFLSYPLLLIQFLLPWSALIIFLFNKNIKHELSNNLFLTLSVIFILFNIPVYWLSNYHKARYIYVFVPFIMNVLAWKYLSVSAEKNRPYRIFNMIILISIILSVIAIASLPFIDAIRKIHGIYYLLALLLAGCIFTGWLYFTRPSMRIIALLLLLGILRIGENEIYFPYLNAKDESYSWHHHANRILSITGDHPVFLAGKPYDLIETHRMKAFHFSDSAVVTPPLVPYELVYYVVKGNHKIMQYRLHPEAGKYYISDRNFAERKNILYEFEDKNGNEKLCLFKE